MFSGLNSSCLARKADNAALREKFTNLTKSLIIKKILGEKFIGPILGPFKFGLILSIWLYTKQQKLLNQNLFQNIL